MTQDTRKDPRAKVLTMTVRYKSATLDEFIEHHSHDVSRGGMFIKTPSPFPAGTLLKFEVKIAAEQRVMQGVGRVVWKREASDANEVRPAGMGVKFIKIDDDSRKVIDQLIDARGEAHSHFEDGAAAEPAAAAALGSSPPQKEPSAATPLMPSAVAAPRGARKATMIGLGALGSTPAPAAAQPKAETTDTFFPKTELDLPAPEDRTVMKQAAELLQDALREAGGSLEDIGTPVAAAGRPSSPVAEPRRSAAVEAEKKPAAAAAVEPSVKPAPKPAAPASPARAAAADLAATAAATRSAAANVPKARAALTAAVEPEGGGGKFVLAFAAVAVVGGIVYFASQKEAPQPASPAVAEEPAPPPVEPAPPPTPEPAAVAPPPAPEPQPSAAPSAAAAAPASAAPSAAAPPPAAVTPPPVVPAPKPKPVVRQPPPRPRAVPPTPTEAAPSAPAEKPAPIEKPPAAEKPVPAPKPVPKKPAPAGGDNPY